MNVERMLLTFAGTFMLASLLYPKSIPLTGFYLPLLWGLISSRHHSLASAHWPKS